MWNDVICTLGRDVKRTRGLGSAIEQFGTAVPYCRKVVLKIKRPSLGKRLVRAAGGERESGSTAETNLTEEIIRDTRARSGIVGTDDDRPSSLSPHHKIYYTAYVLT